MIPLILSDSAGIAIRTWWQISRSTRDTSTSSNTTTRSSTIERDTSTTGFTRPTYPRTVSLHLLKTVLIYNRSRGQERQLGSVACGPVQIQDEARGHQLHLQHLDGVPLQAALRNGRPQGKGLQPLLRPHDHRDAQSTFDHLKGIASK